MDFFDKLHETGFDIYDYDKDTWKEAYKRYNKATGKTGSDINKVPKRKGHSYENVLALLSGHNRKNNKDKVIWGNDNEKGPDIDDIQIKSITGADLKITKGFLDSKGYFDSSKDITNPKNIRNPYFTKENIIDLYIEEAKSIGTKYMAFVDPYKQKIYAMDLAKAKTFMMYLGDDQIVGYSAKKNKEGNRSIKAFVPNPKKEYKTKKYNYDKVWKNDLLQELEDRKLEWFNTE